MDRFPLTTEGAALLQSVLHAYDDSSLTHEIKQLSADFLGWIAAHFELDVLLLEHLRSLPEASALALGMMVGACLAARIPLSFEISDSTEKSIDLSASATYTLSGKYTAAAGNIMVCLAAKK